MSQENNSDNPVSSVGQPAYRQSLLSQNNRKHEGRQSDSMAGMSEDMSYEEQNTDQTDAYSVTSENKFTTATTTAAATTTTTAATTTCNAGRLCSTRGDAARKG